ncbi:hypothetical protein [Peribacillus sp. NPDC058002]|uniref:hypothetical protein n=1 Tax=Peribacillus sp. NPDC058002 TaxID=3346301 RepID=UPI0036DA38F3
MAEVPAEDGKAVGLTGKPVFFYALFVKIVVFKTKRLKVDWSGSARLLREHRPPRGKRAMEGKSTTPHYLVNNQQSMRKQPFFMSVPCIYNMEVGPTMENLSAHLFSAGKR